MIIWAALGANWWKYHGVSQLHPLDDKVLGVPAFPANGHAHGTVYVCTYVQTQYTRKNTRNDRYPFHAQTVDKISSWPIKRYDTYIISYVQMKHCLHSASSPFL